MDVLSISVDGHFTNQSIRNDLLLVERMSSLIPDSRSTIRTVHSCAANIPFEQVPHIVVVNLDLLRDVQPGRRRRKAPHRRPRPHHSRTRQRDAAGGLERNACSSENHLARVLACISNKDENSETVPTHPARHRLYVGRRGKANPITRICGSRLRRRTTAWALWLVWAGTRA